MLLQYLSVLFSVLVSSDNGHYYKAAFGTALHMHHLQLKTERRKTLFSEVPRRLSSPQAEHLPINLPRKKL